MKFTPPFRNAVPVAFAEANTDEPGQRYVARIYVSDLDAADHAIGLAVRQVEARGFVVDESGIAWEEPVYG